MALAPETVIAMAVASVNLTFGVIGFYEYAYRKRIEDNRTKLITYAKTQLKDLLDDIKLPLTGGEIESFKSELEELNTIMNRPDDFLRWRSYLLGLMLLQVLMSVFTIFNPTANVFSFLPEDWAGFFLFILAVASASYLRAVWKIDRFTTKELARGRSSHKF